MQTKSAFASKINWTAAATAAVALLAAFGLDLTEEQRNAVLAIVGVAGPAAIVVLRTWFTRTPVGKPKT